MPYELSLDGVRRVAELTLRGPDGPLRIHAYWPAATAAAPPALVLFAPDHCLDALSRVLCAHLGAVVLALPTRPDDLAGSALDRASVVTEWVADHRVELDADPRQLVVAGAAHGAAVALAVTLRALDQGWPPIRWQVFVDPTWDVLRGPLDDLVRTQGTDLPPATVVSSFPGLAAGDAGFTDRLRRAGIAVAEIRLDPVSIRGLPD